MNMREKMARAISAANGDTPWEELDMEIQGLFFIDADAALSALREPTPAMTKAGRERKSRSPWLMFRAMIDAATGETT